MWKLAKGAARVEHIDMPTHPVEGALLEAVQVEQAAARIQHARELTVLDWSCHQGAWQQGLSRFMKKMAVLGVALATSGSRGYRLLFFYPNGQREKARIGEGRGVELWALFALHERTC